MITYDRNRNTITVGSYVMIAETGVTGVISNIESKDASPEKVRRSKSVSIKGAEGMFSPLELIRLDYQKN